MDVTEVKKKVREAESEIREILINLELLCSISITDISIHTEKVVGFHGSSVVKINLTAEV